MGHPREVSRQARIAVKMRWEMVASKRSPHRIVASLDAIDRGLATIVERVAAILVVVEIAVLFAGMLARYVFNSPLVWSDELASILFLWLATLGAVIALRRGEHMRMTAVIGMMSSRARTFFDVLAAVGALMFVSLMLYPSYQYALEEGSIVTPALEISNAWRAAAMPIGALLMILTSVARLARPPRRQAIMAVLITAAIIIGLVTVGPL